MADGVGTAGNVISTVAPMTSAIPIAGPIISGALGLVGGILQKTAAEKQADQAAQIRKDALATEKQALRPEFLRSMRIRKMQALQGMPGKDLAELGLDEDIAANIRGIKESSPQGATATAAISALLNRANAQKRNIQQQDAQFRYDATGKVADTEWELGNQQRGLEIAQINQRNQGLTAAAGMENAAMANDMTGNNTILGSISSTASSLANNARPAQNDGGFQTWYNNYMASQQPQATTQAAASYGPGYTQIPGVNVPLAATTPGTTSTPGVTNPYMQYKSATPGFWQ